MTRVPGSVTGRGYALAMAPPPAPAPDLAPALPGADRLPIDAGPEKLRLSFSRVDTYRQCPAKFAFSYVEKLPTEPSPYLSWGSSVHAALEAWWTQKLSAAPPVEVLLGALYEHWEDVGFAGMARAEKVRWYRDAQELLRRHHERYAGAFVPAVASEQWFELDIGDGIEVVGSIDQIARTPSGGIGVVDWKTNKRAKTRREVAGSLQLAIYTLAAIDLWGHDPEWVALDFVVPGVRVTVAREDIDTEAALEVLHATAAEIRAARFEPAPNRLCGWCDFRAVCPAFEGDGPDVAGHALVELQSLRRKAARDAARMQELERIVRTRLGEDAVLLD